jgi:hypothetical protein
MSIKEFSALPHIAGIVTQVSNYVYQRENTACCRHLQFTDLLLFNAVIRELFNYTNKLMFILKFGICFFLFPLQLTMHAEILISSYNL